MKSDMQTKQGGDKGGVTSRNRINVQTSDRQEKRAVSREWRKYKQDLLTERENYRTGKHLKIL